MASTDFTSGADTATPAPIATDAPAAASTDAPDWETLRPPRSRFWHFAPGLWLRGGNRIEAPAWMRARLRFATLFHYNARNNVVSVGKGFSSRGLTIRFTGSGNRVEIADNVDFSGEIAIVGKGLCVSIGARSHLRDAKIGVRGAGVRIGADCLFANRVEIRSSDMHRIINRANGKVINPPRPVEIGNHVWVAGDVSIMRGTRIADDCVIGIGSLVNTRFDEPNCVIAGVPARVIRRDITWKR
ncbi:MAG: acyltransferase [Hyphomicrobiaceae bacterium]|nr:acyltransferase [Hyphomicrobiaceae bacterium]